MTPPRDPHRVPVRPRTMRMLPATCLALALVALAGCGSQVGSTPPKAAVTQSLYVPRDQARHPNAGAAGDIVACTTWGSGGSPGVGTVYSEGATSDSPDGALETARGEGGYGGVQQGLTRAATSGDRVLYVVEVDHVVKQAVIVRNGPATQGAGGPGWFVETWAACDASELPTSYAEQNGVQIWTDASGRPAPTTKVSSYAGPEHCSWQSMTFLEIGGHTYVRHPDPALHDFFAASYAEHLRLPPDVEDTGYTRDGEHLWISADRGKAFVGTSDDVELWPATTKPLGCA